VVACIDDGEGGEAVVRLADSLATRLGSSVLLATVQPAGATAATGLAETSSLAREGRTRLERAAEALEGRAEIRIAFNDPAPRLIAIAEREAGIVVVFGDRTNGAAGVPFALAAGASCPVVVVPGMHEGAVHSDGPIVCGIDGSAPSFRAGWAAAELAHVLGVRLHVVQASAALPDEIIAARLNDLAAREAAQLIVIGSRGRGRGASTRLGSVPSRLVATAARPLVIVPTPPACACANPRLPLMRRRLRAATVLSAREELDIASSPELEAEASRLLVDAGARLVIDLSDTAFIDLSAVRALERLALLASDMGGRLIVVAVTAGVRRVVDLAAHHWLVVTDDLDAALDAVRGRG